MISLCIPTYTLNKDLEEMAHRCILSFKRACNDAGIEHEVIVSEDGGMESELLKSVADEYFYHENWGFSKNVNYVWKHATYDYAAIINSDTYYVDGDIKTMCIPGKVTSPRIINQDIDGFAGCFWVAHKDVPKKYGYLDEDMRIYYSDEVYKKKTQSVFEKVDKFRIFHGQAKTVTMAGVNTPEQYEVDKKVYDTKS